MDTSRPESRVRGGSERDVRKPYERPVLRPLDGEGHQPRHPVLGEDGRHDDDFVLHDIVHFDKLHNVIHILNKLDNINLQFHHHHGPGDNNVIIHDHLDHGEHHSHRLYNDLYGPADHQHHHGNRGDDDDLSAAVDHDNYVG